MPRPATHSKSQLAEKLATVFRAAGYEGASMQALSAATGLSKASLYHHFPEGKVEMASSILGEEGRRLQKHILAPLKQFDDPAMALLASLDGVAAFYKDDVPQSLMNSIMIGAGAALFRDDIAAVVKIWRSQFAEAYARCGASAEEAEAWGAYAIERIEGALILCRVEWSRKPLERCLVELSGDVQYLDNG